MVDKVSARPQDVELKVLRATRDLIVSAIGKFEYPGTGMFLILEHAVVGALMAGLSIPDTKKNRRILLERISEDAAQKPKPAPWTGYTANLQPNRSTNRSIANGVACLSLPSSISLIKLYT